MSKTIYKDLLDKKKELDAQIEKQYKAEYDQALKGVIEVIQKYKFTTQQVFPIVVPQKKKVQDKYYDPDTGKSWSGRGRVPGWLVGKDLTLYEIKPAVPEIKYESIPKQSDPRNPFPF